MGVEVGGKGTQADRTAEKRKDGTKTTQAETDTRFVPIPACCGDNTKNNLIPPRGLEPLS
jgi:hypothetical protein